MLKKQKFDQSPMDTYKLEKTHHRQRRNGYMLWMWQKLEYISCCASHIDKTVYVLNGSIRYQKNEGDISLIDKKFAIEVNAGEYIFLPKGSYFYWIPKDGVEVVYCYDTIPLKFLDSMNTKNIDIDGIL